MCVTLFPGLPIADTQEFYSGIVKDLFDIDMYRNYAVATEGSSTGERGRTVSSRPILSIYIL